MLEHVAALMAHAATLARCCAGAGVGAGSVLVRACLALGSRRDGNDLPRVRGRVADGEERLRTHRGRNILSMATVRNLGRCTNFFKTGLEKPGRERLGVEVRAGRGSTEREFSISSVRTSGLFCAWDPARSPRSALQIVALHYKIAALRSPAVPRTRPDEGPPGTVARERAAPGRSREVQRCL